MKKPDDIKEMSATATKAFQPGNSVSNDLRKTVKTTPTVKSTSDKVIPEGSPKSGAKIRKPLTGQMKVHKVTTLTTSENTAKEEAKDSFDETITKKFEEEKGDKSEKTAKAVKAVKALTPRAKPAVTKLNDTTPALPGKKSGFTKDLNKTTLTSHKSQEKLSTVLNADSPQTKKPATKKNNPLSLSMSTKPNTLNKKGAKPENTTATPSNFEGKNLSHTMSMKNIGKSKLSMDQADKLRKSEGLNSRERISKLRHERITIVEEKPKMDEFEKNLEETVADIVKIEENIVDNSDNSENIDQSPIAVEEKETVNDKEDKKEEAVITVDKRMRIMKNKIKKKIIVDKLFEVNNIVNTEEKKEEPEEAVIPVEKTDDVKLEEKKEEAQEAVIPVEETDDVKSEEKKVDVEEAVIPVKEADDVKSEEKKEDVEEAAVPVKEADDVKSEEKKEEVEEAVVPVEKADEAKHEETDSKINNMRDTFG